MNQFSWLVGLIHFTNIYEGLPYSESYVKTGKHNVMEILLQGVVGGGVPQFVYFGMPWGGVSKNSYSLPSWIRISEGGVGPEPVFSKCISWLCASQLSLPSHLKRGDFGVGVGRLWFEADVIACVSRAEMRKTLFGQWCVAKPFVSVTTLESFYFYLFLQPDIFITLVEITGENTLYLMRAPLQQ